VKTYSVHTLPWSTAPDDDLKIVAEGFNWPALLFGPFWALWHGMWKTAIALLVLGMVIGGIATAAGLAPDGVSVLQFLVQIGLGLWGNDLRRLALARRGYVERTVVAGSDIRDAEHRYLITMMPGSA